MTMADPGRCMARRTWWSRLLIATVLGGVSSVGSEDLTLTPGTPETGRLVTSESQTYLLALDAGDFVRIEVAQDGIDVGLALRAPGGSTLAEIGYRSGDFRSLSLIVRETGRHELVVTA